MGRDVRGIVAGVALSLWSALAVAGPGARHDWTGCYLGGNAGWVGGNADIGTSPAGGLLLITTPAQQARVTHAYDFDDSSAIGGGQIGCNWQQQGHGLVLGVEGDLDWADLDHSAQATYPPAAPFLGRTEALSYGVDWLGTLRGRLGYAWDHWLLYATGGLAYGRVDATFHSVLSDNRNYVGAVTKWRPGWTLGGGAEWAFADNWTARFEYLHVDLRSFAYEAHRLDDPSFSWRNDVDTRADVVRFGVNYRLDDHFIMP